MPSVDILTVSTTAPRNNDAITEAINNQLAWINKVMAANGLVANGPLRIVTNEFTSDAYAFDVVQPVRRADAPEGAVAGEKMSLRLEGPVSYDQVPARKAAMTTYTGVAINAINAAIEKAIETPRRCVSGTRRTTGRAVAIRRMKRPMAAMTDRKTIARAVTRRGVAAVSEIEGTGN